KRSNNLKKYCFGIPTTLSHSITSTNFMRTSRRINCTKFRSNPPIALRHECHRIFECNSFAFGKLVMITTHANLGRLAAILLFASTLPLFSQSPLPKKPNRHSQFQVKLDAGAVTSLQRAQDSSVTEFVASGRRLGDVSIKYRQGKREWQSAST